MKRTGKAKKQIFSADLQAEGYPKALKSKFERLCYEQLKRTHGGVDYEKSRFAYVQKHHYTPDFMVGDIFIEAKGGSGKLGFPADRRTAMLRAREQNPALEKLIIVLYSPRSMATTLLTHADWCVKNRFIWCDVVHLNAVVKSVETVGYELTLEKLSKA